MDETLWGRDPCGLSECLEMNERRLYMERLEQWEHEQEEFQRKRDAMGEADLRADFAEAARRYSRDLAPRRFHPSIGSRF